MKKFHRFLTLLLIFSLCAAQINVLAVSFSDVPLEHWAELYIDNLSNRGLINGYEDGTFRPGSNITFGEAFKLIVVATYSAYVYEPVEGYHWAYPYAEVISRAGSIITVEPVIALEDYSTAAALNAQITRVEIIALLGEIIYAHEFRRLSRDEVMECTRVKQLADYEQIPEEDRPWVEVAMMFEIVGGYEDGTFRPENLLTRAEVAKIIYQYYYKV